jgi:hypothetical protein
MHSFYSLIQISPNVAVGDRLSVGLVFFDGEQFQIYISQQKRKIAERLINDKNVNIKSILDQFSRKCIELNKELKLDQLFDTIPQWTNSSYFSYLSSYSNGLIQFSEPKVYISSNQEDEFLKLASMLLNEHDQQSIISTTEISHSMRTIEEKLINRVNNKVHTHYRFESARYPSIHFNYNMDCIGMNGSLVGAKSFEFDQSEQTLKSKMSNYYALILILSLQHHKNIEENNFYLLSREPSLVDSLEHKLWENAVKNNLIQVLDPEESFKVAEIIEENQAHKFLD